MKPRDQIWSAVRRHFDDWRGFRGYLYGVAGWVLFWFLCRDWIMGAGILATLAIVMAILVVKEGFFQKELRRRRALPPSAIRGVSD